ncbi:radical SAM/SPASM domain-containing protein [Reticulibacter mediterranei]|nr:radical SAM protein [Reticulibacter mediterranei]
MKLWLDMAPRNPGSIDQGHDCKDCPDDAFATELYTNLSRCTDHSQFEYLQKYLSMCTLQHAQPLFIQTFAKEYTLVCCTIGSGLIMLLDAEAFALLQCFQYPTTLSEVIQRLDYLSASQIEAATIHLYHYGILSNIHAPIQVQTPGASDMLAAWLHVTNACNLRCDYCYVAKSGEHMQEDTARQAVDAIFRSAVKHRFKRVRLHYAGGEASLQANHVFEIHDYALSQAQRHRLNLTARMLSNGVYIASHVIEQLRNRKIDVMISLDGIGEYHDRQRPLAGGRGSFTRVDRTISRLLEHGVFPSISVTVSSRNLVGIPMLVRYLIERNLPFSLNYYRENNLSVHHADLHLDEERMIVGMREAFAVIAEHLPRYSLLNSLIDKANLQSKHNHTCGVGHNYMAISQRGEVAKCHMEMKRTVTTVAEDDPLQFIRDDREGVQGLSVDEKEGCRDCIWRYWCTGGCPALTYRMTGRYDIQSPNCHIYQALFPDVLQLEALRLLTYTTPIIL